MSNKMRIWDQVKTTNPDYAKQFRGSGGFKGTSVNPMWLAEQCTKIWGPAGDGWGHKEIEHVIVDGPEGTSAWFSHVEFWYDEGDGKRWVSHWGSSTLVQRRGYDANAGKEGYLYLDDEAAKKARTNAVSKCLSLLGFSADLWLGWYNSEQYRRSAAAEHERRRHSEEHEAAVAMLNNLLDMGIGCGSPEDYDAVVNAATNGEVANYDAALATEGFPVKVQSGVRSLCAEHGLKYPDVLEFARKNK